MCGRSEWYDTRAEIVGHDQARQHQWRLHPDIPSDATGIHLDRRWDVLPRIAQRALIDSVLEAVIVEPRPKGNRFDQTRLLLQWVSMPGRTTRPTKLLTVGLEAATAALTTGVPMDGPAIRAEPLSRCSRS